jgi:hypothetical protein
MTRISRRASGTRSDSTDTTRRRSLNTLAPNRPGSSARTLAIASYASSAISDL